MDIQSIRIVNRSDAKGCTYNLGRHSAASVTSVKAKKGERLLGFLHGGMYVTGCGLNGSLTQEISVIKLLVGPKSSTSIINTIRADTSDLAHYMEGEHLQSGEIPPALIGHSLTSIHPAKDGKCQALLR